MLDDRADRLARCEPAELGDRVDLLGGVLDPDLREDLASVLDEQDVDVRVHVDERLREVAGPGPVAELDGTDGRAIVREDAGRERQVRDVVVELGLEGALGVGHATADLVDELPVQDPRQDRQRREHHDDRQRHERGELGADGPQTLEHEL